MKWNAALFFTVISIKMMLSERITESRVEHTQNMENDFLLQIAVKALTKSELMAVLMFREVAMAAGE